LLRAKGENYSYGVIRTIGKGAFGEVHLVRKKQDGRTYALKRLFKAHMILTVQHAQAHAERDALAECDSEWVVRLHRAFQDNTSLYLLMDYIPGGDLAGLRRHHGRLREDAAAFYAAELVMAIEAVHTLGYIHRDIKPDNILIDADGHLKLADFGLAKSDREQHGSNYYAALLMPCVPKSPNQSSSSSTTFGSNSSGRAANPANSANSANAADGADAANPASSPIPLLSALMPTILSGKISSTADGCQHPKRWTTRSNVGTLYYTAPEVITAQEYSFEPD
jgi:protein-serine/threonine kinase